MVKIGYRNPPRLVKKVKKKEPGKTKPIQAFANEMGMTVPEVIAAIADPVIWEIIHGGFGSGVPVAAAYSQKVVPESQVKSYVDKGWNMRFQLSTGHAVVERLKI
ncbi:MAG: hypothetical protein KGI33_06730 [Thaumarchaeota archaeon]|nr:hypothetical protein [Nitrososphaerota archaeon]